MTALPIGRLPQQALAVTILLGITYAVWMLVVRPIVQLPLAKSDEIAELSAQVAAQRSIAADAPGLQKRHAKVLQLIAARDAVWHGTNRNQIGASIQDIIRAAVLKEGGRLESTSTAVPEPGQNDHDEWQRVLVRTRIDGTIGTLRGLLIALDLARPRLFVDSLDVNALQGGSSRDQAQRLTIELGVSGLLDDDAIIQAR